MNYFLSLFCGLCISLMTVVNGQLGQALGVFLSLIFIHVSGLIVITIICIFKKAQFLPKKKVPLYYYTGGIIGLATVIFTIYSFNYLSVTTILALSLLGQTMASILSDKLHLFDIEDKSGPQTLIGIIVIFLGIFAMLFHEDVNILAVIFAFLSGVTVVGNRTINARLSQESNIITSTLWNYITGLAFSFLTLLILGRADLQYLPNLTSIPFYQFTGGIIGLVTVLISIYTTPRIKAVTLSVLVFVGQVFTSIILDYFLIGQIQTKLILGGVIAVFGLIVLSWKPNKVDK